MRRCQLPLANWLGSLVLCLLLAPAATGCLPVAKREAREGSPKLAGSPRHVIVVIGGYANGRPMVSGAAAHLGKSLGAETHVCRLSDLGIMKPIPEYSRELRDMVAGLKLRPEDRLDLVAFSMGGLVCRHYLEEMGGRADKLVTLCTPHGGTTKGARYAKTSSSIRDLQPGSKFLRELNSGKLAAGTEYHSVRISGDRTVRPRFSAILPGARNYLVPGRLHSMTIFRKKVRRLLADVLAGRARPNGPQDLTKEQEEALAGREKRR
jgi:pimeloyl-ACP methyl ester carboxylesterase